MLILRVYDCFIDKSLLKCLIVNDNVNNVKLSYDVIFYVMLFVAAIFISPVFRTDWCHWLKMQKILRGCNKKVMIWLRCASRSYWHWIDIKALGPIWLRFEKGGGYIGFGLSVIPSVILSVIPSFCHSIIILFLLNILRTN